MELNETFFVDLTNLQAGSRNVTIADNQGQGTILNDDAIVMGTITPELLDTPLVGVGRSATLEITLDPPAPAGGSTVTVTSDDEEILTVEPPGTIFIPDGEANGQIGVVGIAAGTTTVRWDTPGYNEGSLEIEVTPNLISLPTTLNVPLDKTVSMPVTIAPDPAPEGGVVVSLVSDNPAVEVLTRR